MSRLALICLCSATAFAMASIGVRDGVAGLSQTSSSLERIILRPAQVGPNYAVRVIPGGRRVQGQVTLDMCGFRFGSEQRRAERLQAVYVRRGSGLYLSNEVVRYRPGGAAAAMREISTAIRTCPRRPMPSKLRGVPPLTYRLSRLSPNSALLHDAIVMKVTESGTYKGRKVTQTSFVVYQRRDDVLTGIYVYGGTINARYAMAMRASTASARNLASG